MLRKLLLASLVIVCYAGHVLGADVYARIAPAGQSSAVRYEVARPVVTERVTTYRPVTRTTLSPVVTYSPVTTYSPAVCEPVTTYYSPAVTYSPVTTYSPVVYSSYYTPYYSYSPVTYSSYYTPYYSYSPVTYSSYYSPYYTYSPVTYSSYYSPYYTYYGARPATVTTYVPGQPIRNLFGVPRVVY
jgi:hypothetical protein